MFDYKDFRHKMDRCEAYECQGHSGEVATTHMESLHLTIKASATTKPLQSVDRASDCRARLRRRRLCCRPDARCRGHRGRDRAKEARSARHLRPIYAAGSLSGGPRSSDETAACRLQSRNQPMPSAKRRQLLLLIRRSGCSV